MLTLPLPLYTPASTSLNPLTPSQMTVHPTHPSQVTLSTRAFPAGLSHVRGLCGPHGRRLDVTLQTDKHAGGSNNFVIHGTAAAAGAGGASSTGNGSPLEDGTGFAVIARMRLERGGYQSSRVPSTLQGRAVPCAPAESNGGQRCAALHEACDGLFSTLKTTLDLQGVPGWPQIYGLGCCEYRLNSTHAAPLVVDARQPLQTSAMWDRGQAGGDWASEYRMQAKAAAPQPLAKAGALVHGQNDRALSACLDARPPLSLEQCALRAALLSAELLRGLTEARMIPKPSPEPHPSPNPSPDPSPNPTPNPNHMQERMISLNEHVLVPSRRRLLEMRGGLDEVLDTREAGNDVLGLSKYEGPEDSTPGRRLAPGRRLLAGLYGRRLREKSGAPGRRLKEVPLKEIRKARAAAAEAEKKKASPRVERPPKTDKALLRGLGHASGQFGFVRDTGQVWRQ